MAVQEKCGAKKSSGDGTCGHVAGYGTDHLGFGRCKFHGGTTPTGKTYAAKEALRSGTLWFGDPVDVSPEEALLGEVHRTAGHVLFLEQYLRKFEGVSERELLAEIDDPDERVRGVDNVKQARLLYRAEREHLTKVCQVALHAGIEERQVRLAERQGQFIADAIRGILSELGVADKPEAPAVIRKHLTLVHGTGREAV